MNYFKYFIGEIDKVKKAGEMCDQLAIKAGWKSWGEWYEAERKQIVDTPWIETYPSVFYQKWVIDYIKKETNERPI